MNLTLNSGHVIPALGLGTWLAAPGVVKKAVETALSVGYRHIDCAYIYQNEPEIGEAFESKLSTGEVKREDLFVTSKLWNTFHRPDLVRNACQISLNNLKLDYLDLYLIHWPCAYKEDTDELFPKDTDGNIIFSDVDYIDTWKAMEELVDAGLVRSIGFSNHNLSQVQRILDICRIKPCLLQIELNPNFPNKELVDFCHSHGIQVTAYAPLGSPARQSATPEDPTLLNDPQILEIAKKHQKDAGQVLIRYALQRGLAVIPKSSTPSRIQSNFNVFDFLLSDEEMHTLNTFNRNFRAIAPALMRPHKYFPFK